MTPYYDDGKGIVIYNGDCRDVLPTLGRFELSLLDPPYLLPGMKGGGAFGKIDSLTGTHGFTDGGFDSGLLEQFDNWFCFCSRNNLADVLGKTGKDKWALLQWCKTNPVPTCNNSYLSDIEYVVHKWTKGRLFGEFKDKSLFFLHPVGDKDTNHPNEKPMRLITKLITLGTKVGESIIDCYMGSGTTLVAAKLEGRSATGIEISEKYCEIAANRLRQGVLDFGGDT